MCYGMEDRGEVCPRVRTGSGLLITVSIRGSPSTSTYHSFSLIRFAPRRQLFTRSN